MLLLLSQLPNFLLVSIIVLLLYLLVSFLGAFVVQQEEGKTVLKLCHLPADWSGNSEARVSEGYRDTSNFSASGAEAVLG